MTVFGITLPPLTAIAGIAAGYIVPGVTMTYLVPMIPTSLKNPDGTIPAWLQWTAKLVSATVPALIVRRFVHRSFGNYMLVGGLGYILAEAIRPYIPGLGYQPMLGQWEQRGALGAYFTRPGRVLPYPAQRAILGPSIQSTPERLDPSARF